MILPPFSQLRLLNVRLLAFCFNLNFAFYLHVGLRKNISNFAKILSSTVRLVINYALVSTVSYSNAPTILKMGLC